MNNCEIWMVVTVVHISIYKYTLGIDIGKLARNIVFGCVK
jgi:hypothetical protein